MQEGKQGNYYGDMESKKSHTLPSPLSNGNQEFQLTGMRELGTLSLQGSGNNYEEEEAEGFLRARGDE